MVRQIEIETLDLKYEPFRMRNPRLEGKLLCSIRERGVSEPVLGVDTEKAPVLLDGFKRLRGARTLGLDHLPYESQGSDPAEAIASLLHKRPDQPLNILEQAAFLDELRATQDWSIGRMAQHLSRSKAWVWLRMDLLRELRPAIRAKLFLGQFPTYAYLYSVRPFMRINGTFRADAERFVLATSGRHLSVRQIDRLSRSCFEGPPELREQILAGRFELVLREDEPSPGAVGLSAAEKTLLRELEAIRKGLRRATALAGNERLKSPAFHAQAGLVSAGILQESKSFLKTVRRLHDRCEQA